MTRNQTEYGLNSRDRKIEVTRKFGAGNADQILASLNQVMNPTEQVLGAIVFLARQGHIQDTEAGIKLANENVHSLLNAATVKDERT